MKKEQKDREVVTPKTRRGSESPGNEFSSTCRSKQFQFHSPHFFHSIRFDSIPPNTTKNTNRRFRDLVERNPDPETRNPSLARVLHSISKSLDLSSFPLAPLFYRSTSPDSQYDDMSHVDDESIQCMRSKRFACSDLAFFFFFLFI